MERQFEYHQELAFPKNLRNIWKEEQGRAYVMQRWHDATFLIEENDNHFIAKKMDPMRAYQFMITDEAIIFSMTIDTDLINNPEKFYLDTLKIEFDFLVRVVEKYITKKGENAQLKSTPPQKYIG
jgi:hypothetical protein